MKWDFRKKDINLLLVKTLQSIFKKGFVKLRKTKGVSFDKKAKEPKGWNFVEIFSKKW